jgi:cytoskeletal protein CcmA (bactofilin family)
MKRTLTLVLLVLFTVLVSGCGAVSTSGDYTLKSGETLRGNLLITSGHATVGERSRVTGSVFMTSGALDLQADAEIEGDVFMTSGNVYLGTRAVVRGDVISTSGHVTRAEGARVEGKISSSGFDIGASIFGTFCLPPVVLLAVLLYWIIERGRKRTITKAPAGHTPTLVTGVVLILIGAIILIQNLTDLNVGNWNWWALFILIPAASSLANAWRVYQVEGRLTSAARSPLVSGAALLLVTGIFLFDLSWGTMWPLFLIIFGLAVLVAR